MKKNRNLKSQLGLSFLFTAGFGSTLLIVFALLLGGWFLLQRFIPQDSRAQEILLLVALIYLVILVGFGLAALLTYVLLSPLNEIMRASKKVAKGDYEIRVNPRGIGKLKELGETFNYMAEELSGVNTLQNDFVNNFSHEFKTPIVSIRGFAKMLQREDLTKEERAEYLDIIIKESDRLAALSSNVLQLSKVEKQKILTSAQRFNASERIRTNIALLASKWEEKNMGFVFEGEDVFVTGNAELLEQVWINLLDNAVKFSPAEGTVWIEAVREKQGARFRFRNRGEAIPPEYAPHIFEKFYQADSSHATQGNGVGLAVVKKIVDLHKGEVKLLQSDDIQTVFEVFLPNEA